MKTNIDFGTLACVCKYSHWAYDENHETIQACNHKNNNPPGHSWGECREKDCPLLKSKMQKPLMPDQFNAIYSAREDHAWPFDACPPYLFLESAIEKNDFCWISWGVAKTIFEEGYRAYSSANYGEKWRFWTSKPTEEERRAVKWMS